MSDQLGLEFDTLAIARGDLMARLDEGVTCPCCDQFAKRYYRSMYEAQIFLLIALYRLMREQPTEEWFHITTIQGHNGFGDGGFAKLRFWNLVEEKPHDTDEDKRTSGWWRLTDVGRDFVRGKVSVAKYAVTYNQQCESLEGPPVWVWECLKKKFSYEELMVGLT